MITEGAQVSYSAMKDRCEKLAAKLKQTVKVMKPTNRKMRELIECTAPG